MIYSWIIETRYQTKKKRINGNYNNIPFRRKKREFPTFIKKIELNCRKKKRAEITWWIEDYWKNSNRSGRNENDRQNDQTDLMETEPVGSKMENDFEEDRAHAQATIERGI